MQREISVDLNENMPLQTMVASNQVPDFIKRVSQVQMSQNTKIQLFLSEVTCAKTFLYLLEYLYCDRFISQLTYCELAKVMDLAQTFKIHKTQEIFAKYLEFTKAKLMARVETEINSEYSSDQLPI